MDLLLGWWSIDEGSQEEQARLYHEGATGNKHQRIASGESRKAKTLTNYGHSAPFRHPEKIESDGTQRQIMVILHLFSCRGGEPDDMRRQIMVIPHLLSTRSEPFGTQRQIMVILHLLSSRGGEPDDMRRNHMIPHLFFTIQRQSSPIVRKDKLWSSAHFGYL
ncbi:hypothetical protein JHK86_027608 [Glycine max]|nr:hypothetical protein JHK86_027608 [Glycine max]